MQKRIFAFFKLLYELSRAEDSSRKFNLSKDEEIRALKKKCILRLLLREDSKRGRCLLDIIFLQVIKLHFLGLIIDSHEFIKEELLLLFLHLYE